MTVKQWEETGACQIMQEKLDFTFWIPTHMMSEEEKKANPKYETAEGYLKTIPLKEAWANMWGNLNDSDKKEFTKLPNFDKKVFLEITGISV